MSERPPPRAVHELKRAAEALRDTSGYDAASEFIGKILELRSDFADLHDAHAVALRFIEHLEAEKKQTARAHENLLIHVAANLRHAKRQSTSVYEHLRANQEKEPNDYALMQATLYSIDTAYVSLEKLIHTLEKEAKE